MKDSLAPGFIVAAPPLDDPNFHQSLVLMLRHDHEGAIGLVLNSPRVVGTIGALSNKLGIEALPQIGAEPIRLGGPVQQSIGWLVYRPQGGDLLDAEIRLSDEVAVSPSRQVLEVIARGEGPTPFRMLVGYSGWAPGQLEAETRAGAWLPIDLDPALVFEVAVDDCWQEAFSRAGVTPAGFMGGPRGSA